MDCVCSFLTQIRTPGACHVCLGFDSFFPEQIVNFCTFDIDAVVGQIGDTRVLARRVAREFLENHYMKYFLIGLADEPAAYPWTQQPMAVSDLFFSRLPMTYRHASLFSTELSGMLRGGLTQPRLDLCKQLFSADYFESQPWSHANHLRLMRPWALEATRALFLVLRRCLHVDNTTRSQVADMVITHLVQGSRGMRGVCVE
jgi:hypothetical protein